MRIRTRSGDHLWVAIVGVPYPDPDGGPGGTLGRVRDVDDLVRARALAELDEAQLRATVDNLLDPLVLLRPERDADGRIVDFSCEAANRAACEYTGLAHDQLVGMRLMTVVPGYGATGALGRLAEVLETGMPIIADDVSYGLELQGGETRYYDVRVAAAGGFLIITFRDQTERRRSDHALAEREELYRLVSEGVSDAVVRFDEDMTIGWVSPSFERLTGFPAEAVVGRSGLNLLSPEQQPEAEDLLARHVAGEEIGSNRIHLLHADGTRRWVLATARPFLRVDGTQDGHVAVLRDIDEQVAAQRQREHEIGHDLLTGLANRDLAVARIDRALGDLEHSRHRVALLSIGVDRLTPVNQALSYAAGDRVLTTIAGRLAGAVGDPDRVARVAGDEFMALLPDVQSSAEAAVLAERICRAARGTITVEDRAIEPTVSIGIVVGDRSSTSEDLLRQASLAARQAKDAGRDRWQFVDPTLAREAQRRLRIESDLREALREHHVSAWFQPVVSLVDRRLRGYEALARWTTDDGVLMMPDDFLPVAEATGLVVDVDLAVLSNALDVLKVSSAQHVAVNVSAASLASPEYADRFAAVLVASGVDPRRLRLEVTETALLDVSAQVARTMQVLAGLGATWYVDDFGTGYSSISHLRDLPVGGLKLDGSFTAGIRAADGTCIKLAQGLIGLAEGLGLDTVAEGIETEFEAGALLGQGWHQGQGWLFGKPEPLLFPPG